MALPINITELVHGKVVEWERLEFKAGWNPEQILHSICAFANDINNWGGGYIIVGIEAIDGVPQFPPKGLPLNKLDEIQGELINICYKIQPNYLPIVQPYIIDEKHILVIWTPAGDMRPYSAPSTLGDDARRQYYFRAGSRSLVAQGANLTRLMELTAKVPFDDRINHQAQINDLDLGLIREFLQEVGSDLFDESVNIPFPELCRQMQIARGPVEFVRPVNVGLLFFNREPHKFFNRAWIELAIHPDDAGRNFKTETFKGPLHHQVRNCLVYLRNEVIRTEVRKITGQAESKTISNYPFNALEEAISNAVYPITNTDLQQRRVVSRAYRNRRIGDFLKELDLTEGKSTGFPIIRDAMAGNGNPESIFHTDKDQILFMVTLPCHHELQGTMTGAMTGAMISLAEATAMLSNILDIEGINKILEYDISDALPAIRNRFKTIKGTIIGTMTGTKLLGLIDYMVQDRKKEDMLNFLGLTNKTENFDRYIKPLIKLGWLEWTIPEKPKSKRQKYKLTSKGRKLLQG